MKNSELRQKSKEELKATLKENREKLSRFRFDLAAGKVKNIKPLRSLKKEIARILTILRVEEYRGQ
jgi:large subunit ribosomal protein L29